MIKTISVMFYIYKHKKHIKRHPTLMTILEILHDINCCAFSQTIALMSVVEMEIKSRTYVAFIHRQALPMGTLIASLT